MDVNFLQATSWQKRKSLPKWSTYHFICRFPLSTYAQHLGQDDFSTYSSGLSKSFSLRRRRCLYPLDIPRSAPVDADLILVNQDLAGFFTSFDQERFIGAWFMLLDFLRPPMNVADNEVFSVYPGKANNPGDLIKGRTFRRLNVTRKIVIKDVPSLLTTALEMQTFALGQQHCIRQRRGSPMGSPLFPALCLMVVSISEQIWSINFKQILSNHHFFIKHIRYVDNRLIFGDARLQQLPPYEVLLDAGKTNYP